ncbi:MAG TPA: DegT/DnrJ/EryC1/StrS family aminotransferase [Steroidobacteraceae bacterium]|nr:DegT/DnrJ/EryC1/StrS family aminotransferase [Steroidobacteraceae bacterium]
MSAIAMNDFRREPDELVAAELAACERVIRSGWWILGREVTAFEQAWATYLGTPAAVGCANGLDAIELGLRALGIGPGDEVITTPMTAFATVLAVLRAGAVPVLADIDPDTAMLSVASVKRCMGPRTKAVLLVHLYGQAGPLGDLLELAEERRIHLLEDCAQAHGAMWDGRPVGNFGTFAAWSFYPTKNLGAIGDGGALTTARPEVAEKVRVLRNYGQSVRYQHPVLGMNSRLDELQAAILSARLQHLPRWIARRRDIAARYAAEIRSSHVRPLPLPEDRLRHSHHLFVVRCAQRLDFQAHLRERGIESLIHYPIPVHLQEPCRQLGRDPQGLRAAEVHANTCLSLPCHAGLSDAEVGQVISAVNQFGG